MPTEVITNTGVTPVVADKAGHEIAPGDYLVADLEDKVTAAQIAAGNIGVCARPDDLEQTDPAARAAFEQLDAAGTQTPTPEQAGDPADGAGTTDEGADGNADTEGAAAQPGPAEPPATSRHRSGKTATTEGAK